MRAQGVAGTRAGATREAIAALSGHGLDPAELLAEVASRIGPIVPHDSGAWWTVDPEMAARAGATVSETNASHSVFLSKPEPVAAAITAAIQGSR